MKEKRLKEALHDRAGEGMVDVRDLPLRPTLVPRRILVPLWLLALALPNLIWSGPLFADPLRPMKWVVIGVSIALAVLAAGWRLMRRGGKRIRPRLDPFGALWALMLAYCAAQPLWVDISSRTGLVQELTCLAAVWAFYVLSANAFPSKGLYPLLWLAGLGGAISAFFGELQVRKLNTLFFLQDTPFEFLLPLRYLIWPGATYEYVGNAAQQNLLGVWLAICSLGLVWLFFARKGRRFSLVGVLNFLLLAVNLMGLWNSKSRSGLLSLFAGLLVLGLMMSLRFGRVYAKRLGLVLLLFAVVAGGTVAFNQRGTAMLRQIPHNFQTFGRRTDIWATSLAMFKEHPMGVGVGQYKWHYLEAQREKLKTDSSDDWRYTHWAHNEFLHWFCEAGVIGGLMLFLMYALWIASVLRALRSGREISLAAIWGCSLVALISFDALWTRPFHRFEDIIWLALAFALANRELMAGQTRRLPGWISRPAGAICACAALAGLFYLYGGVQGNLLLHQGLEAEQDDVKIYLMEEARGYPFVSEEAARELGLHYIKMGSENNDDISLLKKGVELLWNSFRRQPIAADMAPLLHWGQRFQEEPLIREIVSYLKPGTYQFVEKETTNTAGEQVTALYVTVASQDLTEAARIANE